MQSNRFRQQIRISPRRMSRSVERRQAADLTRLGRTWEVINLFATGISPDLTPDDAFFDQALLHEAVLNRHADTAAAIVACGGNLEHKDKSLRTAFSYAAQLGAREVALVLLAAGCREDERDSEGHNPELVAREHGHPDLSEFIRQVSLARYQQRNLTRPSSDSLPSIQLHQPGVPETRWPLAYAEPGRLGATLLRHHDLMEKLDRVLTDPRVRPLIESIIATGQAQLKQNQEGPVGKDHIDLMGFEDTSLRGPLLNHIRLTKRGWDAALPMVQQTLDLLDIEFDADRSGLICRRGQFRLERVAVDFRGHERREFNMTHTETGKRCRPAFSGPEDYDQSIFEQNTFIQRKDLVRIDGWEACPDCTGAIRPFEERVVRPSLALSQKALVLFQSTIKGDEQSVLDGACAGAPLDERTIYGNSLVHIGCWCRDRMGWCKHSEALATALACGTTPGALNSARETGLHVAAFFGRYYPYLMLMAAGADPHAVDDSGLTAADMARMNGHAKFASLIENITTARELYERCRDLETGALDPSEPGRKRFEA